MNPKKYSGKSALLDKLVAKAQRLGELWYRTQRVETSLIDLNVTRKSLKKEMRLGDALDRRHLSKIAQIATQETKALGQEQRELSRVTSGLRKEIEVDKRKLERP